MSTNPRRVAFSATQAGLDASLDPRFGRCSCWVILDLESGAVELLNNTDNKGAEQGAGIQAAQTVLGANVQALVTGHCGPKAFRVLQAAGVAVYCAEEGTVRQAAERLQAGQLPQLSQPDVASHW
ncbi:MAG TPA: NifB/NifX family molybdenum-iron cluster-binding protein [Fibrobacteraceae bacterium]|nr:NifB/NifX family molybdenum-iron cluster-binding protein [Fibrobacteraceae bacterium]